MKWRAHQSWAVETRCDCPAGRGRQASSHIHGASKGEEPGTFYVADTTCVNGLVFMQIKQNDGSWVEIARIKVSEQHPPHDDWRQPHGGCSGTSGKRHDFGRWFNATPLSLSLDVATERTPLTFSAGCQASSLHLWPPHKLSRDPQVSVAAWPQLVYRFRIRAHLLGFFPPQRMSARL